MEIFVCQILSDFSHFAPESLSDENFTMSFLSSMPQAHIPVKEKEVGPQCLRWHIFQTLRLESLGQEKFANVSKNPLGH